MPAHYLMRKTGRKLGAGIPDKDHFLLDFLGGVMGICMMARSLPVIGIKNAYDAWHLFLTYGA